MPKYKFFEVKNNSSPKKIEFKEFNLATANIKRVRSDSNEGEQQPESKPEFHA
jgi:hypothetical protein